MRVEVWNAVALVVMSAIAYQLIKKVLWNGLWEPLRLRRIMAKQGVQGPPFRFLIGQLLEQAKYMDSFPDVVPIDSYAALSPTATPHYALFIPQFPGKKYFLYFWGTIPRLVVRDPEMAKELFIQNHSSLKKSPFEEWFIMQLFGKGLVIFVDKKWATERRTMNPFFHQNMLKGMVEAMIEGTATVIHKWEQVVAQAGGSAEIDVEPDMQIISGRVLSLTVFGGDYETGEQIHKLESELGNALYQMVSDLKFWLIPFYRKIPTKQHRRMDQIFSKADSLVCGVTSGRLEAVQNGKTSSYGDDLLGRMLESATLEWGEESPEFNLTSVVNNCKLFYVAGQESLATAMTFTLLMLALYPEWQNRARKEVLEVVGDVEENFDAGMLSHLKVVGMIINETMRTFPPFPTLVRVATKDLQLKNLFIPEGLTIEFAPGALHQDKDYWGDDAAEFNPERFANGISGACSHAQAYNPFGLGPKHCIGSNYAMMELKIVVARVLRRFELLPSPNYKHHPIYVVVTKPKYGMPIILKAI